MTKICLLADLTLLLAWDAQEAGKIIETYKVFEHKPPDLIMGKQENNNVLVGVWITLPDCFPVVALQSYNCYYIPDCRCINFNQVG